MFSVKGRDLLGFLKITLLLVIFIIIPIAGYIELKNNEFRCNYAHERLSHTQRDLSALERENRALKDQIEKVQESCNRHTKTVQDLSYQFDLVKERVERVEDKRLGLPMQQSLQKQQSLETQKLMDQSFEKKEAK